MLDSYELLRFQLELEGLELDAAEELSTAPSHDHGERHFAQAVMLDGNCRLFLDASLPANLKAEARTLNISSILRQPELLAAMLAVEGCQEFETWVSYILTHSIDVAPQLERVTLAEYHRLDSIYESGFRDFARTRPVYVAVEGGQVVAACTSVRHSEKAAEAWVATDPAFRRKGYGSRVVAAWGNDLLANHKVAFYSHKSDNEASRGLAQRLGLTYWAQGVGFT